ncbi:uncharacterized protein [Asterias amurensis]|uniref:uncharacterized protein n=1 Tax=Asterias amurensis TaxID=7602 RepID=UPI003AB38139
MMSSRAVTSSRTADKCALNVPLGSQPERATGNVYKQATIHQPSEDANVTPVRAIAASDKNMLQNTSTILNTTETMKTVKNLPDFSAVKDTLSYSCETKVVCNIAATKMGSDIISSETPGTSSKEINFNCCDKTPSLLHQQSSCARTSPCTKIAKNSPRPMSGSEMVVKPHQGNTPVSEMEVSSKPHRQTSQDSLQSCKAGVSSTACVSSKCDVVCPTFSPTSKQAKCTIEKSLPITDCLNNIHTKTPIASPTSSSSTSSSSGIPMRKQETATTSSKRTIIVLSPQQQQQIQQNLILSSIRNIIHGDKANFATSTVTTPLHSNAVKQQASDVKSSTNPAIISAVEAYTKWASKYSMFLRGMIPKANDQQITGLLYHRWNTMTNAERAQYGWPSYNIVPLGIHPNPTTPTKPSTPKNPSTPTNQKVQNTTIVSPSTVSVLQAHTVGFTTSPVSRQDGHQLKTDMSQQKLFSRETTPKSKVPTTHLERRQDMKGDFITSPVSRLDGHQLKTEMSQHKLFSRETTPESKVPTTNLERRQGPKVGSITSPVSRQDGHQLKTNASQQRMFSTETTPKSKRTTNLERNIVGTALVPILNRRLYPVLSPVKPKLTQVSDRPGNSTLCKMMKHFNYTMMNLDRFIENRFMQHLLSNDPQGMDDLYEEVARNQKLQQNPLPDLLSDFIIDADIRRKGKEQQLRSSSLGNRFDNSQAISSPKRPNMPGNGTVAKNAHQVRRVPKCSSSGTHETLTDTKAEKVPLPQNKDENIRQLEEKYEQQKLLRKTSLACKQPDNTSQRYRRTLEPIIRFDDTLDLVSLDLIPETKMWNLLCHLFPPWKKSNLVNCAEDVEEFLRKVEDVPQANPSILNTSMEEGDLTSDKKQNGDYLLKKAESKRRGDKQARRSLSPLNTAKHRKHKKHRHKESTKGPNMEMIDNELKRKTRKKAHKHQREKHKRIDEKASYANCTPKEADTDKACKRKSRSKHKTTTKNASKSESDCMGSKYETAIIPTVKKRHRKVKPASALKKTTCETSQCDNKTNGVHRCVSSSKTIVNQLDYEENYCIERDQKKDKLTAVETSKGNRTTRTSVRGDQWKLRIVLKPPRVKPTEKKRNAEQKICPVLPNSTSLIGEDELIVTNNDNGNHPDVNSQKQKDIENGELDIKDSQCQSSITKASVIEDGQDHKQKMSDISTKTSDMYNDYHITESYSSLNTLISEDVSIDEQTTGTSTNTVIDVHSKGTTVVANEKTVVTHEKTVVTDEKTVVANKKTVVANKKTVVADEKTVVANEKTVVANEKTIVANEKTVVANEKTNVAHEKTIVADEKTVGADEKTVVADEKTVVADEKTVVAHKKTIVANKKTVVADEKTVVADEKTVVADEKTVVANEKTNVAHEKTIVADEKTVVADEKTVVADEKTVVADEKTVVAHKKTIVANKKTVVTHEKTVVADEKTVGADENLDNSHTSKENSSTSPNSMQQESDTFKGAQQTHKECGVKEEYANIDHEYSSLEPCERDKKDPEFPQMNESSLPELIPHNSSPTCRTELENRKGDKVQTTSSNPKTGGFRKDQDNISSSSLKTTNAAVKPDTEPTISGVSNNNKQSLSPQTGDLDMTCSNEFPKSAKSSPNDKLNALPILQNKCKGETNDNVKGNFSRNNSDNEQNYSSVSDPQRLDTTVNTGHVTQISESLENTNKLEKCSKKGQTRRSMPVTPRRRYNTRQQQRATSL